MITTPSGIPIIECDECGWTHPSNRTHCDRCGRPSAFIDHDSGYCLSCLHGRPWLRARDAQIGGAA